MKKLAFTGTELFTSAEIFRIESESELVWLKRDFEAAKRMFGELVVLGARLEMEALRGAGSAAGEGIGALGGWMEHLALQAEQ